MGIRSALLRYSCILALVVGACSRQAPPEARPEPDPASGRTIAQGPVTGLRTAGGAQAWLGLPFAQAPTGALRWRAPRPADGWSETRQAYAHSDRCPQLTNALDEGQGMEPGLLLGSEDCLTLNIYAPPFEPGAVPEDQDRLPVMVWIHGGGNVWGHAGQYDGSTLAVSQNVLVVTIQYRLGPLGWFAHGALRETADSALDRSANPGTLDMIAALQWVRDNIAAFGGDPERVTIFGESAGGHNVATLLASPLAANLFHRAIVQSGNFDSMPIDQAEGLEGAPETVNASRAVVSSLLEKAGRAGGDMGAEDLAGFLQGLSLDDLYAPYSADEGFIDLPRVINDGIAVPTGGIRQAIASRSRFNAVPVITGTTRDETKLFNFLNPDYVSRYFGIFYVAKDPTFYDVVSDYQSLIWRVRAVDEPARAMASGGHDAVYAYRFDWDDAGRFLITDFKRLLGAAHGLEIPFMFGRFQLFGSADRFIFTQKNEAERVALSDAMMSYWAQFAYTGDPGQGRDGTLPAWRLRRGASANPSLLVLDAASDEGIRMIATEESLEGAIAALERDDRLQTAERRCDAFNAVVAWHPIVERFRDSYLDGTCSR